MDGAGGGAEWVALSEPQGHASAAAAASARWGVVHTPPPDGRPMAPTAARRCFSPRLPMCARGIGCCHGGPHTAAPTAYIMSAAMFTQMGYAVAMPNYRGSFGYGDAFLGLLYVWVPWMCATAWRR